MSEPDTGASGGVLWPTPVSGDVSMRSKKYAQGGSSLSFALGRGGVAKMFNTPNVFDALPPKSQEALEHEHTHREGRAAPNNLRDQVNVMEGGAHWPTPRAHERNQKNSNDSGMALSAKIKEWPTPQARDYRNQHANGSVAFLNRHQHPRGVNLVEELQRRGVVGQLNPDWVEWLMGWPIGWTKLSHMTVIKWPDWSQDPADLPPDHPDYIPRVIKPVKGDNRRNRLKALGNGQVPQTFVASVQILNQRSE